MNEELPLPPFFDEQAAGRTFRVPYEERARYARELAKNERLGPAADDDPKIALVLIDNQNTFCLPEHELFVAGRSGTGAVEDSARVAAFLHRYAHRITRVVASLDTHNVHHVFHQDLLIDASGNPPAPFTTVSVDDVHSGKIRMAEHAARFLGLEPDEAQRYLQHYVTTLAERGKYDLLIWPYHAQLGGVGHALVSIIEEAMFVHAIARASEPQIVIKGRHPLTEHYSVMGPEVSHDHRGEPLEHERLDLVALAREYDALIVGGQAKSHCVGWTLDDLRRRLADEGAEELAPRFYLLDDASSAVVIPDGPDFTEAAEEVYARCAEAGMRRVKTSTPLDAWPAPPGREGWT